MPSVAIRRRTRGYSALPPVPPNLQQQQSSRRLSTSLPVPLSALDKAEQESNGEASIKEPGLDVLPLTDTTEGQQQQQQQSSLSPTTYPPPFTDTSVSRPALNTRSTSTNNTSNRPRGYSSTLTPSSTSGRRSRSRTIQSILGKDGEDDVGGVVFGSNGSDRRVSGSGGDGLDVRTGSDVTGGGLPGLGTEPIALGPVIPIQGQASTTETSRIRSHTTTSTTQPGQSSVLNMIASNDASHVRDRANSNAISSTSAHDPPVVLGRINSASPHDIATAQSGESGGSAPVGVRFSQDERNQIRRLSGTSHHHEGLGIPLSTQSEITTASRQRRSSSANSQNRPRRSTLSNVLTFGLLSSNADGEDKTTGLGAMEDGLGETQEERVEREAEEHHEEQVVEHLDVIDPEVSAGE